jgi:hypothetical protein
MSRRSRLLGLGASFAGLLAVAGVAVAQNGSAAQPGGAAEARLAWAKRHVELVCRPLEEQRMFDKATRCYNDVARLMGVSEKPTATAQSSTPAQKPAAEAAPAPAAAATPAPARPAARPAPVRTAAKPAPVRVAATPARPAAQPVVLARNDVAPARASGRCSGLSCMRYTLLGVGF